MSQKRSVVGRHFDVVVAYQHKDQGIGFKNSIPWNLSDDISFFRQLTTSTQDPLKKNAIIMGRSTFESLPSKKALPNRLNIVLSRSWAQDSSPSSVIVKSSLEEALEFLAQSEMVKSIEKVYVIGGQEVYKQAIDSIFCNRLYITELLNTNYECDKFFPKFITSPSPTHPNDTEPSESTNQYTKQEFSSSEVKTHGEIKYQFTQYQKNLRTFYHNPIGKKVYVDSENENSNASVPAPLPYHTPTPYDPSQHPEYQYLNLIRRIMNEGNIKGDRTGTGTISIFGTHMRFPLRNGEIPVLTTKRVFWRGVAEELLWFIAGNTSALDLQKKNIHIWDGNSTREFLDSLGLTEREEGDLGPVYGYQWRHFGAKYVDMHTDYTGQGVDQLKYIINLIKNNPNDRRIIMSAWNPVDLDKMALPPCHVLSQYYVHDGKLSCFLYQRSADMGLGVPFNIASYSLLTYLLAQVCDLEPCEFVYTMGDCHIYRNHIDALKIQIERQPHPFPTISLNPNIKEIDQFTYSDITLHDYHHHSTIKMEMAV